MKPSSSNRQLPDLSLIRRELTASPELRLGWMQTTPSPSREEGENFFLDIPSYRAHREAMGGSSADGKSRRAEVRTLRHSSLRTAFRNKLAEMYGPPCECKGKVSNEG